MGAVEYLHTFSDWMRRTDKRLASLERRRSTGGGGGAGVPYAQATGKVDLSTGSGTTVTATVTFPVGRFSVPPVVLSEPYTSVPGSCASGPSSITASSFVLAFYRTGSTVSTSVFWSAVQMTSSSAYGLSAELVGTGTVECPTAGCDNEGVALVVPIQWVDDTGATHDVDECVCGVCGTILEVAA